MSTMTPSGVEVRDLAVAEEAPSAAAPDQEKTRKIKAGTETGAVPGGGESKAHGPVGKVTVVFWREVRFASEA